MSFVQVQLHTHTLVEFPPLKTLGCLRYLHTTLLTFLNCLLILKNFPVLQSPPHWQLRHNSLTEFC